MDAGRYRDLFLTEARDHLVTINQSLIALEHAPVSSGRGRESVDELFRAVHTVKGMSGVMGYDAVGALSHAMETLLARVRAGEESLEGAPLALLFEAADALEAAIESASVAADGNATERRCSWRGRRGRCRRASALDVTSLVEQLLGRRAAASAQPTPAIQRRAAAGRRDRHPPRARAGHHPPRRAGAAGGGARPIVRHGDGRAPRGTGAPRRRLRRALRPSPRDRRRRRRHRADAARGGLSRRGARSARRVARGRHIGDARSRGRAATVTDRTNPRSRTTTRGPASRRRGGTTCSRRRCSATCASTSVASTT